MKLQLHALAVTTSSTAQSKGNGSSIYTEMWLETILKATSVPLHEGCPGAPFLYFAVLGRRLQLKKLETSWVFWCHRCSEPQTHNEASDKTTGPPGGDSVVSGCSSSRDASCMLVGKEWGKSSEWTSAPEVLLSLQGSVAGAQGWGLCSSSQPSRSSAIGRTPC